MKNYIIPFLTFLGCFWTSILYAQVEFFGESEFISNLNTPDGENYLVLNPHDKGMAFTKERRLSDPSAPDYEEVFYHAFDSTWQATIFLDWIHDDEMFSPVGFDPDGNILFNKVIKEKGVYDGTVMMFPNGDENGIELDIPFLRNKSPIQSGCISKDGRYMILSLESNNTYGVEDLYVVKKNTYGEWSSPINLGAQVNSEFQEITPHLGADNKTLFFSTNGRGGEGSFDIFYTERLDESWRKWSEPKNIGNHINTKGAETSFTFLNKDEWAYYVSSQNSDGYGDIKRIKIRSDIEEDTLKEEAMVAIEDVEQEVVLKILDKETKSVLSAEILHADSSWLLPNGLFTVDSVWIGKEMEIKSKGYLPKRVTFDSAFVPGIYEIVLESIAVGNTITLNSVLFKRGTAEMLDGTEEDLELLVEMLNDNPDVKILLKGHTDNQGDPVLNVKLSEERVKSVRKYLMTQGINAYRIKGTGYGGNDPIASNETEATRRLNRRVEFEVIED